MSGYGDYSESFRDVPVFDVPVIDATEENFVKYGTFSESYQKHDVIITPWPTSGKRPLMAGTGSDGGIAEGKFSFWFNEDKTNISLRAHNYAVNGNYVVGIQFDNEKFPGQYPKHILTREANLPNFNKRKRKNYKDPLNSISDNYCNHLGFGIEKETQAQWKNSSFTIFRDGYPCISFVNLFKYSLDEVFEFEIISAEIFGHDMQDIVLEFLYNYM